MQGSIASFPSHCGSRILHGFDYGKFSFKDMPIRHYKTLFSVFINRADQHKAYKVLTKKYKILYQSPLLVNPTTDREYFIVIFLNEKP